MLPCHRPILSPSLPVPSSFSDSFRWVSGVNAHTACTELGSRQR
jgi:hypothetical protein